MKKMYDRTIKLVTESAFNKIQQAKIIVVGVGGVGGMVAEILARSGVKNITLIDGDTIDETNLNRQIFALEDNIGKFKAVEMANRIKQINSDCDVKICPSFIDKSNVSQLIVNADYVVDCIDDISAKIELIKYCKSGNINIISALGAGNRICSPEYEITDIYKTSNDPLAKILRKKLREAKIENLDVVVCRKEPDIRLSPPASVMWHPVVMASVLVGFVINKFLKN